MTDSIHTWRDFHEQHEQERLQRELEHRARGGEVEEEDGDKRGFYYERIPLKAPHKKADGGGVSYQRPIYGGSLAGAFKLPHGTIRALGNGDPEAGLAVSEQLFGTHSALGPGVVHPLVVQHIGEGSLAAGHRVLRRFVATLRQRHGDVSGIHDT